MPKLSLRQNALHTLHHAIEHLQWSEKQADGDRKRKFDEDDQSVSWREGSSLCFVVPEFTRLPAEYNLKFAVLHLIQASELLLKSYIEQQQPAAVFVCPGSKRTIGLHEALKFTTSKNPKLFTQAERALLLQAKDLRNSVEHYQIEFNEAHLRLLCIDFVAICMLISQELLSINIVEAFSWDSIKNEPDPVGDYLSSLSSELSATGKAAARKTALLWVGENTDEPVFLCLNCGARAVTCDRGVCMGCGAEGDEELVSLLQEFEGAVKTAVALEKRADLVRTSHKTPIIGTTPKA